MVRLFGALCLIALIHRLPLAAATKIHAEEGSRYWKQLHFGKFRKDCHGPYMFSVRAVNEQILFGEPKWSWGACDLLLPNEQTSVRPHYLLELASGKLRLAQPMEWSKAEPVSSHIKALFKNEPIGEPENQARLLYGGRQFLLDPAASKYFTYFALSPDGSWLAIMSYFGHLAEGMAWFQRNDGKLVVDIYQVSTGYKVAALKGSFAGHDPQSNFLDAVWISDRHFVISSDSNDGAWLCDLSPLEPNDKPTFDFVRSAPEQDDSLRLIDERQALTAFREPSIPAPPLPYETPPAHSQAAIQNYVNEYRASMQKTPKILSSSPVAGAGSGGSFSFTTLGLGGPFATIDLLFNDRLDERSGCLISYSYLKASNSRSANEQISIESDGHKVVRSNQRAPTSAELHLDTAPLESDKCTVSGFRIGGGYTSALTGVMQITFRSSFFGTKNIYARVANAQDRSSGWKRVGTWIVKDDHAPEPVALIPYQGEGREQMFTLVASDPRGVSDLATARIKIQPNQLGAGPLRPDQAEKDSCFLKLSLAEGPLASESVSPISADRQPACNISLVAIVRESAESVRIKVKVTLLPTSAGRLNIFAQMEDKHGDTSTWERLGVWTVPD